MSKAIQGAAMLAGAVAMGALAFADPALVASPLYDKLMASLAFGGIAMEAGAIAGALTSNRGMNITTRQAASFRQLIYGCQRVGGVEVYRSTTGSKKDQFNYVIVLATHVLSSIESLYLDGRRVYFNSGVGTTTRNGVTFGGTADSNTYTGPNGQSYNFNGKVYCEACYGDQTANPNTVPGGGYNTGLNANDGVWGPSANGDLPYLGGCAYVYLKVEYDTTLFPQEPEVRFTVFGKPVFDPRTNQTTYSDNWALVVADVLSDPLYGVGDSNINQAQLIAAANVCDEQVALAGGGTENRYSCHYHYDTSLAPGDVLSTMMNAACGRISRVGGEWYIYPAYYSGPVLTFDQSFVTAKTQWKPTRPQRELFNRVTGTYIAPNYPYAVAGDLYDSNGWYQGTVQNNYPYAFQPTNYPQYACDALHGYPADEYLAQDLGIQLPKEIPQQCVLSVAQAQRLAKIFLMRNRQQGSGSFLMSLAAFQLMPCDTFLMNYPQRGWTGKLLEVNSVQFHLENGSEQSAPMIAVQIGVNETDPSVYAWSVTEELGITAVPLAPLSADSTTAPPTNVEAISSAATQAKDSSGIVQPRIQLTWNTPDDAYVTQIQMQYKLSSDTNWLYAGAVDVTLNSGYISPVIAGQSYDLRIRSARASGAASAWVGVDGEVVSASGTNIATGSLNPNSPANTTDTSEIDSIVENSAATVRIYDRTGGDGTSWTRIAGSARYTEPAAHITGLGFTSVYYICLDVTTTLFYAFTDFLETLNDNYYYLGAVTTCSSDYSTGSGSGGSGGTTGTGSGGTSGGGGRNPVTTPIDEE